MKHLEIMTEAGNISEGAMQGIEYMQDKLYESPFPRLESLEIVMYPKSPSREALAFATAYSDEIGDLHLFLAHLDIVNFETTLFKHRLQERFLALASSNVPRENVVQSLWEALFARVETGPGMLYWFLSFSGMGSGILRCGPFFIFEKGPDETSELKTGDNSFSSSYEGVVDLEIEPDSSKSWLVVSQELLDTIDANEEEFKLAYLQSLPAGLKGKELLAAVLKRIAEENTLQEKLPGMILVLSPR